MYRRLLTAASSAGLTLALTAGLAGAQGVPVGTPGEPQCHGERVSAGNHNVVDIPELEIEGLRLTPKGRVLLLNTFGVDGRTDWTVQDFHERVRKSCDPEGEVTPPAQ